MEPPEDGNPASTPLPSASNPLPPYGQPDYGQQPGQHVRYGQQPHYYQPARYPEPSGSTTVLVVGISLD